MAITPIQDRTISRQVQDRIAGRGIRLPCRVTVATSKGEVTLTGNVQHAHQKTAAVQAASGISGVRRVVDRLIIKVIPKY